MKLKYIFYFGFGTLLGILSLSRNVCNMCWKSEYNINEYIYRLFCIVRGCLKAKPFFFHKNLYTQHRAQARSFNDKVVIYFIYFVHTYNYYVCKVHNIYINEYCRFHKYNNNCFQHFLFVSFNEFYKWFLLSLSMIEFE